MTKYKGFTMAKQGQFQHHKNSNYGQMEQFEPVKSQKSIIIIRWKKS